MDPLRPVVFLLVLRTRRENAIALLAGWALALSFLFVVAFALFGGNPSRRPSSGQRTWASALLLLIGILLVVIAARRWSRREQPAQSIAPEAVLRRLDRLDRRQAGWMGVLIQPRSLTIAAALVVARDRSGVLSLVIGFAIFAVVSTAALLAILIYDIRRPELAERRLAAVASSLERQGPKLFTIAIAVGGGYLVVDAVRNLVA